jgi:chaperone required for assembly of F1-ATPase
MWLTRLANTAVDRVAGEEPRMVRELANYAGSDLVCYRAADPQSLVTRQGEFWDPVLTWAEETFGVRFLAIQGVVHHPQPQEALEAVARYLQGFDCMRLCAVHNLTTLTGSLLIALMMESGALDPERAWLAAQVDEDWQAERWGVDEEAAARRAGRKQEFDAAVRFLGLLPKARHHPL